MRELLEAVCQLLKFRVLNTIFNMEGDREDPILEHTSALRLIILPQSVEQALLIRQVVVLFHSSINFVPSRLNPCHVLGDPPDLVLHLFGIRRQLVA